MLTFIRFGIVGIVATVILYGVYWVALHWLNPTISYSIGYFFAFITNYILTTSYTFKVKKSIKNGIGFVVSNIINYFVSIGLLNLFLNCGINDKIAPIVTIIVATLSNFIIVHFVMKKL